MEGSIDWHLPQPWVQEEIPRASLKLAVTHCSQCPIASGGSLASPRARAAGLGLLPGELPAQVLRFLVVVGSWQA